VDTFGAVTSSTFDGLDRLTGREMIGTNVTPVRVNWGYDAAGDLTTYRFLSGTGLQFP
jgi:hypothetical protein